MKYFHRTSLAPDSVLAEADNHFGALLQAVGTEHRARSYEGSLGRVTVRVAAEGGHYTLIDVSTDQVGESEADTVAKRFLALVHARVDPTHQMRGAY